MNYPSKLCIWIENILQRNLLKSIVHVDYTPCDKRSDKNGTGHLYTISIVSRELDPTEMQRELYDWSCSGVLLSPEKLELAVLNWLYETYPVLREVDIQVLLDAPGRRIKSSQGDGKSFREEVRSRYFARLYDGRVSENATARELVQKQWPENDDAMADCPDEQVWRLSRNLAAARAQQAIYHSARFMALKVERESAKYSADWPVVPAQRNEKGSYEGQFFPYVNPLAGAWKSPGRELYAHFNLRAQNIVIHEKAVIDIGHSGCPIERGDFVRVIYLGEREAVVIEHKTYREYFGAKSSEIDPDAQMFREHTDCSAWPNDLTRLLAGKQKQIHEEMASLYPRTSTIDQRLIEIAKRQSARSATEEVS